MGKGLQVYSERCIGCRSCEMACSFEKEGQFRPSLSRIGVLISQVDTVCFPVICFQCRDAPCLEACPVGAIERDGDSGVVRVNEGDCTGCGQCVSACSFGSILFDVEEGKAKKCDLCEGKPACVEFCPTHAIAYLEKKKPFRAKKAESNRFYGMLSAFRMREQASR